MKNDEIKQANRKALPKFLLFAVVCTIVGGMVGYYSGHSAAKGGLDQLVGMLKEAGAFFGARIAPWLMLALAVIVPVVCIPIYRRAKKLVAAWDGEDEDVSDAVDRKLSAVIWLTSAAFILSYFLIAASYSGGFATFDSKDSTIIFFIGVAAFFGIMAEATVIQQKCVDTAKQTNPEKKASVYDMRFQKKWLEDCDEAEKLMIGKCALKAYAATNAGLHEFWRSCLRSVRLCSILDSCPRSRSASSGSSICRCTARRPCAIPRSEAKSRNFFQRGELVMKLSSTGCFILAVTWLLVSLLWFFWVKNTTIGIVWLIVGAGELVLAFIMRHKETCK